MRQGLHVLEQGTGTGYIPGPKSTVCTLVAEFGKLFLHQVRLGDAGETAGRLFVCLPVEQVFRPFEIHPGDQQGLGPAFQEGRSTLFVSLLMERDGAEGDIAFRSVTLHGAEQAGGFGIHAVLIQVYGIPVFRSLGTGDGNYQGGR